MKLFNIEEIAIYPDKLNCEKYKIIKTYFATNFTQAIFILRANIFNANTRIEN